MIHGHKHPLIPQAQDTRGGGVLALADCRGNMPALVVLGWRAGSLAWVEVLAGALC